MSAVLAVPDLIARAATDLAAIGSTLDATHLAAAPATLAVLPAAADEVSTAVAHLFSQTAQAFQTAAGQAVAFHDQFVQHLGAGAAAYAGAEIANANLLQPLEALVSPISGAFGALRDQVAPVFNAVLRPVLDVVAGLRSDFLSLWVNTVIPLVGISLFIGFLLIAAFFIGITQLISS